MCGLVGYIGNNAVAETLLNGLKIWNTAVMIRRELP